MKGRSIKFMRLLPKLNVLVIIYKYFLKFHVWITISRYFWKLQHLAIKFFKTFIKTFFIYLKFFFVIMLVIIYSLVFNLNQKSRNTWKNFRQVSSNWASEYADIKELEEYSQIFLSFWHQLGYCLYGCTRFNFTERKTRFIGKLFLLK